MAHVSSLIKSDIDAYLRAHERKGMLRFITCGSVDDGKSTLIGRLLFDSKVLFEDQLAAVEADSKRFGTQGDEIDFALLVDGLAAEREQGITIDVAYRYFSTDRRKFIVADTPGHEQYTRNMVTGASTADVAVVMVDARKGILTQTRRHTFLVSLIGIRHVALAVNKMDLVGYSEATFHRIADEYRSLACKLGLEQITFLPVSALRGDNITSPSAEMTWYQGGTLLNYLETVEVENARQAQQVLRFPVQWVNRPGPDFRGFSGKIASGTLRIGDRIRVQSSGCESTVARIVTADGDLDSAVAGQAVTITLEDEVDISRGDMLSHTQSSVEVADQFEISLIWMDDEPLLPGRSYLLKMGPQTASAIITDIKYQVNVNTFEHAPARQLDLNGIGVCNIAIDRQMAFDPYRENRDTGGFILIDRMSNHTVGAGLIHFALRRSHNIHRQQLDVDKAARSRLKGQKPCVIWLTGLSGAGKSTIANLLEKKLVLHGHHTYLLDGDNVRHGLCRDLGFSEVDRVENIRRVAEVSKLMVDAGLIVITAFISPFRSEREYARSLFDAGEFVEVHVDTPLSVAERRDVKGLYQKARAGKLKNFTGIDSPYEAPLTPEIRISGSIFEPEESANAVLKYLLEKNLI